ncbi:MAG: M23 family metallopeptidase [Eubacteriales bacterium]
MRKIRQDRGDKRDLQKRRRRLLRGERKQVLAANNGTVVFAGYLEYSGYTVIIDHGLGLKTWYYNMDATNVQVGQSVTKGESIGVSGNTGFTSNSGVHVTTTVFNVPVCPYSLWENGVVME